MITGLADEVAKSYKVLGTQAFLLKPNIEKKIHLFVKILKVHNPICSAIICRKWLGSDWYRRHTQVKNKPMGLFGVGVTLCRAAQRDSPRGRVGCGGL